MPFGLSPAQLAELQNAGRPPQSNPLGFPTADPLSEYMRLLGAARAGSANAPSLTAPPFRSYSPDIMAAHDAMQGAASDYRNANGPLEKALAIFGHGMGQLTNLLGPEVFSNDGNFGTALSRRRESMQSAVLRDRIIRGEHGRDDYGPVGLMPNGLPKAWYHPQEHVARGGQGLVVEPPVGEMVRGWIPESSRRKNERQEIINALVAEARRRASNERVALKEGHITRREYDYGRGVISDKIARARYMTQEQKVGERPFKYPSLPLPSTERLDFLNPFQPATNNAEATRRTERLQKLLKLGRTAVPAPLRSAIIPQDVRALGHYLAADGAPFKIRFPEWAKEAIRTQIGQEDPENPGSPRSDRLLGNPYTGLENGFNMTVEHPEGRALWDMPSVQEDGIANILPFNALELDPQGNRRFSTGARGKTKRERELLELYHTFNNAHLFRGPDGTKYTGDDYRMYTQDGARPGRRGYFNGYNNLANTLEAPQTLLALTQDAQFRGWLAQIGTPFFMGADPIRPKYAGPYSK